VRPLTPAGNLPAGAAFVVLGAIPFVAIGVCVRLVATEVPNEVVGLFRNPFSVLLPLSWPLRVRLPALAPTPRETNLSDTLHFPAGLDATRFLAEYWQRRPLLLRGALPNFDCPLPADELAGLACEPQVESRLVLERGARGPWELRHGPFAEDDFAALPESHWTLLVQDMDKHVPEVAALLRAFGFIPDWRLDDIMISYAADQGSVGPHVDQYDVFLVQAEGQRRWRVDAGPDPDLTCIPGLDLRILERFSPTDDWVLAPGDVLYLPPGVPHWGIAEGECMTWSVGLRAAAWRELAADWCEHQGGRALPAGRYRDPGLRQQARRGEIRPEVFAHIRSTLEQAIAGAAPDAFRAWLGAFLTEPKEHLRLAPAEPPLTPAQFRRTWEAQGLLLRHGWSRLLFCQGDGGADLLFANGEVHRLPKAQGALLEVITEDRDLPFAQTATWLAQPAVLDLLCNLYNAGHYVFPD
jgi:50S ribosomal protein L16 3-hydroxylase